MRQHAIREVGPAALAVSASLRAQLAQFIRQHACPLLAVVAMLSAASTTLASTSTWTGATSGVWSVASNWSGGVPGAGFIAIFNSASSHTTLDLGSGVTIATVFFDTANTAAYTIGSGAVGSQTLTFQDGGMINVDPTDTASQLFNAAIVLGTGNTDDTFTFNNGSLTGTLTFAGGISSGANTGTKTLTVTGSGNTLISGIVGNGSGTVALVKSGSGTVTLTAANTYTGGTTVNGGILVLDAGAFGTGIVNGAATVNNGGTLTLEGNSSDTIFPTDVNDTINVNGGGLLNLSMMNTQDQSSYIGAVNLSSADGTAATVSASDGSNLRFGSSGALLSSTGSIANTWSANIVLVSGDGDTMTFNTAAGNTLNVTGTVSDYSTLTGTPVSKTGAGTLTLSGSNTYNGGTTISSGTLTETKGTVSATTSALGPNTSAISVAANAALNIADTDGFSWAGNISGAGSIIQNDGPDNNVRLGGTNSGFTGTYTALSTTRFLMWDSTNAGSASAAWVLNMAAPNFGGPFAAAEYGDGSALVPGFASGSVNTISLGALSGTSTTVTLGNFTSTAFQTANTTFSVGALNTSTAFAGKIVNTTNGSVLFASSTVSLLKVGTGTLTLTGQSTYSGGTTIAAGAITAGVANALPSGTALTIGNAAIPSDATFNTGGFAQTISSLAIYAQNILTNTVLNVGTGTLTLDGNISLLDVTSDPGNLNPAIIAAGAGGTLDLGGAVRNITVAGQDNGATPGDLTINAIVTDGGINFTGNPSSFDGQTTGMTLGASTANTYTMGTTVNAGTLNVAATTTLGAATGSLTLNTGGRAGSIVILNSSQTIGSLQTGTLLGGGAIVTLNDAGMVLTVNQNVNTTYAGVLNGVGSLTMSGTGTLTLSGANTYSGGTVVSSGTLQVASGGSIDHSGADVNVGNTSGGNATLSITGGDVTDANAALGVIINNSLTIGTATITAGTWSNSDLMDVGVSGTGTLNVNGGAVTDEIGEIGDSPMSTGTATVTAGSWSSSSFLVVGNFGNGTLNLAGSGLVSVNGGAGTVTLSDAGGSGTLNLGTGGTAGTLSAAAVTGGGGPAVVNFNQASAGYTFSPQLTGPLSVNNLGPGTTILTGSNTYTGATTVSSGTLTVALGTVNSGTSSLGANTNPITVTGNGTLNIADTGHNFDWAGNISGNGTILENDGGTFNVRLGGTNNAFTGTYDAVSTTRFLMWDSTNAASASAAWVLNMANGIEPFAAAEYGTGDALLPGFASGSMPTINLGALSGTSTTVELGNANFSGSTVANAETAFSVGALGTSSTFAGMIVNTVQGSDAFASSAVALVKTGTGTLTLTGSNSYTGATEINGGTLDVAGGGSIDNAGTSMIVGIPGVGNGSLSITGGSVTDNDGDLGLGDSSGTATLTSGTWNNIIGLNVGDLGTGTLNLTGSGVVTVSSGAGIVALSPDGGDGTLNLGTGGTAGTLNAASVSADPEGDSTVNFNHTGSYTFAPQLTGEMSLNQIGPGTTILTGSNTYTGFTTVSSGTLTVALGTVNTTTSSLGPNTNAVSVTGNGTLNIADTSRDFDWAGNFSGGGTILENDGGTFDVRLGGDDSGFTGAYTALSTTRYLMWDNANAGSASANWVLNMATGGFGTVPFAAAEYGTTSSLVPGFASDSNPNISLGALSGTSTTVELGNATFTNTSPAASTAFSVGALGTSSTFAGMIVNTVQGSNAFASSTVTLVKTGTGTLTLTGSNSYTGATEISGGTLEVAGGGSINNGAVEVEGGTLEAAGGGSVNETGMSVVVGIPDAGNSSLSITGGSVTDSDGELGIGGNSSGTATLTSGTWNNITSLDVGDGGIGTLNLSGSGVVIVASGAGTLTLGVGAATATLNLGASGTAGTLNAASVTGDAAEGATATVSFDQNGAYTFSPQLTGQLSVNQSGTGTTILAGNDNYTGATTASAGFFLIDEDSQLGASTLTLNGGGIRFGAPLNDLRAFTLGVNGGTLDTNGFTVFYGQQITGGGVLVKAGLGTLTLTASNGYTGGTAVTTGTLEVTIGGSINHSEADLIAGRSSGDNGSLNITGGSVTDGDAFIGGGAGSTGAATITSGTWTNTANLDVGFLGTGTLNIDGGSVITDMDAQIGSGTQGTATVSGGTWTIAGTLFLGFSGTGTLNLTGTGMVMVNSGTGTVTLAEEAGSGGALNLGAGGTAGTLSAQMVNGVGGTATVNFDQNSSAYNFRPQLTGALSVNQMGPGTTIPTNGNTYTGTTTVSSGTLTVEIATVDAATSSIGANTNPVSVTGNGTLDIVDLDDNFDWAGNLSGNGTILQNDGAGIGVRLGGTNSGFTGTYTALSTTRFLMWDNEDAGSASAAWVLNMATANGTGPFAAAEYGTGDPILPGFASGASPTISLGALSSTSTTVNLGNGNFSGGTIAAASTTFSVGALGTSSTYAGVIVNTVNGSNPITSSIVTLIKTGAGTLTLTGSNSYTGLTEINSGTLQVAGGGSINNGGVLVQGGTLNVPSGGSVNEAGGGVVVGIPDAGNSSLSITGGSVTDSDAELGIGGDSSGTATLTSGTWNNITSLEVGDGGIGTLNLSGSGVVIVASGAGTLTLGVGAATATLNLGASGTAGTLNAASVTGDAAEGATATVNFDQNGAYTFSPQLTGQLSVNQSGTGTTILAGNSSYTGPTTVSAGSLIVNGSLSGGSALSVNGGTLSGTGSVGAVTVNSGGTLAANTPNFTTGALSLTAAGTFALTINTSMATAGKVTASSLTLDAGNSAVLTISDSGIATALARGTKFAFLDYTPGSGPTALFSYTGIINGVETTAALNQGAQITLGDNIYSFSYDGTDGLDSALTLTVIPEPATWAMLLGGLGMLAGFQRSRRRRKF